MGKEPTLLHRLIAHGVLFETGVDGLYGRSGAFEAVVDGLERAITKAGAGDGAEVMRFPPGMNRHHFEASGYLKSFPHLAGTVHCFCGNELAHAELLGNLAEGKDWTKDQRTSDIVVTPAACYPLYPVVGKRGPLGDKGGLFDLSSYCFRHEPSQDPARMQMFRMREYVRIGAPEQVMAFRQDWIERGRAFVEALQLPYVVDLANDPFFGRGGRMVASAQREQGLKFELLIPVTSTDKPTACLSFNYHQDHFGTLWNLKRGDGETAHTACVGFGLERLTLALFEHHGFDLTRWPARVLASLGLGS